MYYYDIHWIENGHFISEQWQDISADEAIVKAEEKVRSGIARVSVVQVLPGTICQSILWQSFVPGGFTPYPFYLPT